MANDIIDDDAEGNLFHDVCKGHLLMSFKGC